MYEIVKREYVEPMGVTQEGRDAIRIHNQNAIEIKKFKESNQGFWSKYGGSVMPVVGLAIVAMLFLVGMKYVSDSWADGVEVLSGDIRESNDNMKWWQNSDALDKISNTLTEKVDEKNAPPVG